MVVFTILSKTYETDGHNMRLLHCLKYATTIQKYTVYDTFMVWLPVEGFLQVNAFQLITLSN